MNYKKNYFLLTLFLLLSIMAKSQVDEIRAEARTVFLIDADGVQSDYEDILIDLDENTGQFTSLLPYPAHGFDDEHLQKLVELTQARARKQNAPLDDLPGLDLAIIETDILSGFDWWYQNVAYYEDQVGWFANEIGKQRELQKISILFYDYIDANDPNLSVGIIRPDPADPTQNITLTKLKAAISYDFPTSIVEPDDGEDYTGANKADIAGSIVAKGLLENEISFVDAGKDEIRCAMVFSTLNMPDHDYDGIREDYSFQQHNTNNGKGLLYAGGYGQSLIHNVASWGTIFSKADYDFESADKQIFFDFMLKGYRRMVIGNTTDYSANGRYIARKYPNNNAAISPEDMNMVVMMAGGSSTTIGGELELMRDNSVPGSRQEFDKNHYHFWKSDYVVHHEPAYFSSVRLCSKRTIGTECVNAENKSGYWLPYGCTFLYQRGDEYIKFSGTNPQDSDDYTNIFPFWDWFKIPGVTCPEFMPEFDHPGEATIRSTQNDLDYGCGFQNDGNLRFAGNTGNRKHGVTTMLLNKDYDNNSTTNYIQNMDGWDTVYIPAILCHSKRPKLCHG